MKKVGEQNMNKRTCNAYILLAFLFFITLPAYGGGPLPSIHPDKGEFKPAPGGTTGQFSFSFAESNPIEQAALLDQVYEGYSLIIMNNTNIASANQARDYVISKGGKIAILVPPHIMLGWISEELSKRLIGMYGIESIIKTPIDLNTLQYRDEKTVAAVVFFNAVSSGYQSAEMAASLTEQGMPLINDALEKPPIINPPNATLAPAPGYSDSMTGTVAVCLFFIESNGSIDPNLYTWNATDQQNTYNRALSGLSWWADQAATRGITLSFTIYSETSPVTQQGYEPILHASWNDDALWINQIMANLGYSTGDKFSRVTAFNSWFKNYAGTDWAYSVFIGYNPSPAPSTFTDGYMAYAYYGGPYVQELFINGGWGESNFGFVLTHETGHIFWACDEYYQAGYGGCTSCGVCQVSGPRPSVLNGNCEYCNPSAVACMMRAIDYQLCTFTPPQIGWITASCIDVIPSSGSQGTTLDMTIAGSNTHFAPASLVSFSCTGITVNSTTVNSLTHLIANITIASNAPLGGCDVSVVTGSETITCSGANGAFAVAPDNVQLLVREYYLDILDREPDQGGLDFWTNGITHTSTTLGIYIGEGFQAEARLFFTCQEYQDKNKTDSEFVTDLYQTFLQREPDQDGLNYWVSQLSQGLTRDILITTFAYCDEFKAYMTTQFGADTTRPENNMVNDFYRGFLNRFPDDGGFNSWLTQMRQAQCTGQAAVRDLSYQLSSLFVNSAEYAGRNRNNAQYVEDLYNAILKRGADPAGFQAWVNNLNNGMTRQQALQVFHRQHRVSGESGCGDSGRVPAVNMI